MALTLRAVPTIVASCFFAELETEAAPERDAAAAWERWVATFAPLSVALVEEPEHTKAREDLATVGRERFLLKWTYLLGLFDAGAPGEVRARLSEVFASGMEQMRERQALRERQRGRT